MEIIFTKHAGEKFNILKSQGFEVTKAQIYKTLKRPDSVVRFDAERFVARAALNQSYALRVVFKKENDIIKVITFYPAKKERYKT